MLVERFKISLSALPSRVKIRKILDDLYHTLLRATEIGLLRRNDLLTQLILVKSWQLTHYKASRFKKLVFLTGISSLVSENETSLVVNL